MHWVTMCMCSFPVSLFPNQSFNFHLLVACCQQIIIIKNRKLFLVGVLKWDGFKYDFPNRKERKLPKKPRDVSAKRDQNFHRTLPLPQQQGTKKVCEMGSGTWLQPWVWQNHFKIRNLQIHDGYIKGSLLVDVWELKLTFTRKNKGLWIKKVFKEWEVSSPSKFDAFADTMADTLGRKGGGGGGLGNSQQG